MVGLRLVALGLALGRARMSNKVKYHELEEEGGDGPPAGGRSAATRVDRTQLLGPRPAPRSDAFGDVELSEAPV